MSPQSILIDYLTYTETKSCTLVGVALLFSQFSISPATAKFTILDLIKHDKIEIIPKDPEHESVVRLVTKLKVLH
jgi:hypothetical protein